MADQKQQQQIHLTASTEASSNNQVKDLKAQKNQDSLQEEKSGTNKGSSKEPKKKEKKKKKEQYLYLCTTKCRYVVVKKACRQLGFKMLDDEAGDWDIHWNDTQGVTPDQLAKLMPYQRINHYPGMYQLARKNNLSRNLMRMQKTFKEDYNFFPKTWILPSEMSEFKNQFSKKKNNKTFIVKPVHLCQGKGIFLVRKFEDVDLKQGDQYVAQRYLHKPYLIDGLKFDLRIYALVYGVDPLRIFVYQEGLARFATEGYVGPQNGNLDNLFMHLTNYAIQKNSDNFQFNEDQDDDSSGHKRSLTAVLDHIRENEPQCDADKLWLKIQDIIAKTIITVQPSLQHAYRSSQPDDLENSMCFEILGFDVILDYKLKPYVLEVNSLASFGTDSPLDKKVKLDLMKDTFTMLNLSVKRKKKLKKEKAESFSKRAMGDKGPNKYEREVIRKTNQQKRDEFDLNHLGNYRCVYPVLDDPDKAKKFDLFLEQSKVLWSEFTGGSRVPNNNAILKTQQTPQSQVMTRAKTDPPGIKPKVNNLSQAYQKQTLHQQVKQPQQLQDQGNSGEKIFVKRNTAFQYQGSQQQHPQQVHDYAGISQINNYPAIQPQQSITNQQQLSLLLRNTGTDFNKTTGSSHSHNNSNVITGMQLQDVNNSTGNGANGMPSPMKKRDVLETINVQDSPEQPKNTGDVQSLGIAQTPQPNQQNVSEVNQFMVLQQQVQPHEHGNLMMHQMQNGFMIPVEFGISSTNLAEAIHKRFPMVRLEQPALRNYGSYFYSPAKQSHTGQPLPLGSATTTLHHSASKKHTSSMSRQQFPTAVGNHQQLNNFQRMKPLIGNAINNSNDIVNAPNSASTAISTSGYSNSSHHHDKKLQGGSYIVQQPQTYQLFIQNQQNQHQMQTNVINLIKPMEILKRTVNYGVHPSYIQNQQNIQQRGQNKNSHGGGSGIKHQNFGNSQGDPSYQQTQNQSHIIAVGKSNQSSQRHASQSVKHQPQTLADWLYVGDKISHHQTNGGVIQNQSSQLSQIIHHSQNKSNPKIGANQSLAIQRNIIRR